MEKPIEPMGGNQVCQGSPATDQDAPRDGQPGTGAAMRTSILSSARPFRGFDVERATYEKLIDESEHEIDALRQALGV